MNIKFQYGTAATSRDETTARRYHSERQGSQGAAGSRCDKRPRSPSFVSRESDAAVPHASGISR